MIGQQQQQQQRAVGGLVSRTTVLCALLTSAAHVTLLLHFLLRLRLLAVINAPQAPSPLSIITDQLIIQRLVKKLHMSIRAFGCEQTVFNYCVL